VTCSYNRPTRIAVAAGSSCQASRNRWSIHCRAVFGGAPSVSLMALTAPPVTLTLCDPPFIVPGVLSFDDASARQAITVRAIADP
jgi:hypothetical protein